MYRISRYVFIVMFTVKIIACRTVIKIVLLRKGHFLLC